MPEKWGQPARWQWGLRWAGLPVVLLAAAVLVLLYSGAVRADRGGDSAVTIVPVDGKTGGVRLRAQTVDVTLVEDEQGMWADTRVWLQISNPSAKQLTLTLALPGPQLTGAGLPANMQLKLGDLAVGTQPAKPPATGLVAEVPLAAEEQAGLQLTYRQMLPEASGVVTFAYPLSASAKWGGAPESLRMTVSFAASLPPEEILGRAPEPDRANSQTMVWSWDYKAPPDIWLAFMTPSWWSRFSAARNAATADSAGPAEHLALSEMYRQLAGLPRLSFKPDLDFYARYYPAAVAELQAAAKPSGSGGAATPAEVKAHVILAGLYRDQAARAGQAAGNTYLELAAAEAQTALSLGATDPELRPLARNAYLLLASAARNRGDLAVAETYLARLATLEPASRASTAAEEQKAAQLVLAAELLARGKLSTARQIVADSFGDEAVNIPALRAPVAGQVVVNVETSVDEPSSAGSATAWLAGRRRLTLTLANGRDAASLKALVDEVVEAWQPLTQVTTTSGADWVAVEFTFSDDRGLIEMQSRLAKLLPADPELALLATVLEPEALAVRTGEDPLRLVRRYAESVDLAVASDAWLQRGQEIVAAGARLAASSSTQARPAAAGTPAPGATPANTAAKAELGTIQRALWTANASEWSTLAAHSYVHYATVLRTGEPSREWQVAAGTRRALEAQSSEWRLERLAAIGAGGGLLLLLVAFVIWRWL